MDFLTRARILVALLFAQPRSLFLLFFGHADNTSSIAQGWSRGEVQWESYLEVDKLLDLGPPPHHFWRTHSRTVFI